MQQFALDVDNRLHFAKKAVRQKDYFCPECRGRVRLRGGDHRQDHFFHLEPSPYCKQSGKGMIHLEVQHHLIKQLPIDECVLEYRFPQINRIADVAWITNKIVFEVQCSTISSEEVLQRNADYRSIGWQVIWILHDSRYNQWRLSGAENALASHPHYFTNMDSKGEGIIYDQFQLILKGSRKFRLPLLPVQVDKIIPIYPGILRSLGLNSVLQRSRTWPFFLQGDLFDITLKGTYREYLQAAQKIESEARSRFAETSRSFDYIKKIYYKIVARPYSLLLQMLLERSCK